MSLEALLTRLRCPGTAAAVPSKGAAPVGAPTGETPETSDNPAGVTAQPAPALGCTHETPVTPPSSRPDAVSDALFDPDRGCWPASGAMNTGEIDAMIGRIEQFTEQGLASDEAEQLADRLVVRDREQDDRRSCFECAHLMGSRAVRRCSNCRTAGIALRRSDARIGRDFGLLLQRCDGFADPSSQQEGETP